MKLTKISAIIITSLLLLPGCREDEVERVPNVPVNISIQLQQPAFVNLQIVGGWEYLTGGSEGIIVYRASIDEFKAFDRHCTWNVGNFDRVVMEEDNIIARDTDGCGSSFIITDGSAVDDPAFVPLTEYQTSYNPGTETLLITN
jgi:nitrite reductase/ring-hydroxylating ferredoxin subunit